MTLQHGTVLAIACGCLASLVLTADGTSVTCSAAGHCQMEGEEKSKDTVVLLQNVIHRKVGEDMVDEAAQESVNGDEEASDEDGEFESDESVNGDAEASDEDAEFESDEDGERASGPCPSTKFCPAGHTFLPKPSMSTTMLTKRHSCASFLPRKRWPCYPRPRAMNFVKRMKDLCCVAAPTPPPPPQVKCGWSRYNFQQCVGSVAGGSPFWGLADAQKKCSEVGLSNCSAVTCRKIGQIETCTMRKCATLSHSGHGEVTYTPNVYPPDCGWRSYAFQKCANVAGETFWGDEAGARAKCLELGPCKCRAVTCRKTQFTTCTIMPTCAALTRAGHGEKTYKPNC